jgi:formylglycine-generating enzyme required for sulfatase activity
MPTFEYVYRDGGVRNYRGGSHLHGNTYVQDVIRSWDFPDSRRKDIGFRLVEDTDAVRVGRGGSWNGSAQFASVARRYGYDPADRSSSLGFCLVVDCEKAPIRGSNWYYSVQDARRAHHFRYVPSILNNDTGFRLATSEELQHAQP